MTSVEENNVEVEFQTGRVYHAGKKHSQLAETHFG